MKILQRLLLAGIVAAVASGRADAATATFSQDGSHVFLIDPANDATGLLDVDLANGKAQKVKVPGKLGVEAVSLSRSGYVLWATTASLQAYDPVKRSFAKVCDAPAGTEIDDIAYNPATGATLICTRPKLDQKKPASDSWDVYLLPKNAHKPLAIFNRRVRFVEGPVFDRDGTLFFATEGDAWAGAVSEPSDPNDRPTLFGYRFAPLATRETTNATPSQTGVRDLAITKTYVYAHLRRMGGSGWGDVIRFKRPQLPAPKSGAAAEPEDPSIPFFRMPEDFGQYSELYRAALGSVEMLGENGSRSFVCASPDGQRAFYRTFGGEENARAKYWLAEEGSAPKQIAMDLP